MKPPDRIVVLRTDRLGDVIMTLPTLDLLRQALPDAEINFIVRPELLEPLAPFFSSRKIKARSSGFSSFWESVRYFRSQKFSAALLLYSERSTALALRFSGIPTRFGLYSKALSFFLLSEGLRQKRSQSEKNEAEYNLELGARLLTRLLPEKPLPVVRPIELAKEESAAQTAEAALETIGVPAGASFLVVHPGMGGSALNLSPEQYAELISALEKQMGMPAVVTVGPAPLDQAMIGELKNKLPQLKVLSGQTLTTLREVFRKASYVIGPSTGPLHLAHFVGTTTVGLYSPVRSQHPERWRPWGGTGKSFVVFPEVDCPGTRHCLDKSCSLYFCFQSYPWTKRILEILSGA